MVRRHEHLLRLSMHRIHVGIDLDFQNPRSFTPVDCQYAVMGNARQRLFVIKVVLERLFQLSPFTLSSFLALLTPSFGIGLPIP